ncbi:uncharacterized protein RAG0_00796 [Rhynchosporium agropyri]|uniref:J domain-containing protein n=1 Tax=Rhynchosporium agropyri TaxID=914238 RepID=A0A1E1JU20_9HELO|nr:uncharacterized protein RAG0_00796 [Rhynchosporium agropyri]
MGGFVDHYQILRVGLSASDAEIKKAYQNLSKAFHPDKNDSPTATATFQLIGESYSVLKDSQKRSEYDAARKIVLGNWEWSFPDTNDGANSSQPDVITPDVIEEFTFCCFRFRSDSSKTRSGAKVTPFQTQQSGRPRPELRTGAYIINEVQGSSPKPPRVGNGNTNLPKQPLSPRRLLDQITVLPSALDKQPADLSMTVQTFQSWKKTELEARNRRVDRWILWARENISQIQRLHRSAWLQHIRGMRLEESEKVRNQTYKLGMTQKDEHFKNDREAHRALLRDRIFQYYLDEKNQAIKQFEDTKRSIGLLMVEFQDNQDAFERAEHWALIAVAVKTLEELEKDENSRGKDRKDTGKSMEQWNKLQSIDCAAYQTYRLPTDLPRVACVVGWQHRLRLDHKETEEVRVCRRCSKDILLRAHKCEGCHAHMCSTCDDNIRQLQAYHVWLEAP